MSVDLGLGVSVYERSGEFIGLPCEVEVPTPLERYSHGDVFPAWCVVEVGVLSFCRIPHK